VKAVETRVGPVMARVQVLAMETMMEKETGRVLDREKAALSLRAGRW